MRASSLSATGATRLVPALLTSASTGPKASSVRSTSAATSVRLTAAVREHLLDRLSEEERTMLVRIAARLAEPPA
jgi:hypothetical protein